MCSAAKTPGHAQLLSNTLFTVLKLKMSKNSKPGLQDVMIFMKGILPYVCGYMHMYYYLCVCVFACIINFVCVCVCVCIDVLLLVCVIVCVACIIICVCMCVCVCVCLCMFLNGVLTLSLFTKH